MNILIACEYSGIIRDTFRALGHNAWSCDLIQTHRPGPHLQCHVQRILGYGWDLMIAHPPCTYLSVSGLHWNKRDPIRDIKTASAFDFFTSLWRAPIKRICLENPIGYMNTNWQKPTQIIQPYDFGEDASKATCLWLKNLPILRSTSFMPPTWPGGRYANQTESGQNNLSSSQSQLRAKTYQGIASAMAAQWR